MEYLNQYHSVYLLDKNKDILDEIFVIGKYNVVVKRVLDYYKLELRLTYPQLLDNLNEILMTISKELLDRNNSLESRLFNVLEESEKPFHF